ncbi:hypothetical protein SAMN05443428_110125 [Caloramator quimbayensis]|uniref:Uncharacterized protein n=1 Tax=Caloramator quimbayensis TaxID=1147123 RepID=A0A1T4XMU3_9CLOT|nr:hypothetical protein [Caloramator quimbayensis]SKA90866.1 hypothetical protein SAMN05443428_110125 [Caloramator quimbayensis]
MSGKDWLCSIMVTFKINNISLLFGIKFYGGDILLILLSIFWGIMICLILCAPYSYYFLFIPMLLFTVIFLFIYRKKIKKIKILEFILIFACFIFSYFITSFIIFKPVKYMLPNISIISTNKEAVIFYCEGEMEKYTPYYSNYFFKDAPYILKPIYAFQIKQKYKILKVNPKINELTKVAEDVRSSLLNYKPYFFYIAFSGYYPEINSAINSAILDGCGSITIINYTKSRAIEDVVKNQIDLEYLYKMGIKIKFTEPIYNSNLFAESISNRVKNMPIKYDGIIIVDEVTDTSSNIKSSLIYSGYFDDNIIIDMNVDSSMEKFKKLNSTNILYINLLDAGSGIRGEIDLPNRFKKYSTDMKITGMNSWGYDKNLVKACIYEFLSCSLK